MDKKYTYNIKVKGKKVSIVVKPIDKELWEQFYAEKLCNFIMDFEHNADIIENSEMEKEDYYIKGMVKGMWIIFSMIEKDLVKDE